MRPSLFSAFAAVIGSNSSTIPLQTRVGEPNPRGLVVIAAVGFEVFRFLDDFLEAAVFLIVLSRAQAKEVMRL